MAGALQADLLTFLSDVPGVLDDQGNTFESLSADETEVLIKKGVINGGMIPKVRTALSVISENVANVRIVNLAGLSGSAGTLFTRL